MNNLSLLQAVQGEKVCVVRELLYHGCCQASLAEALAVAVETGQKHMVQMLLQSGADAECRTSKGDSIITVAIRRRYNDIVRILVRHGADLDSKDCCGQTPLMTAIQSRVCSAELIQFLVSHSPDLDAQDSLGETAIMKALQTCDIDAIMILVEREVDLNVENNEGQSVMMMAAAHGLTDLLDLLLHYKDGHYNQNNVTPLMLAVMKDREDLVRMIVGSEFADVNKADSYGQSALVKALLGETVQMHPSDELRQFGDTEHEVNSNMIRAILSCGEVNINAVEESCDNPVWSPLILAVKSRKFEIVKILVEAGAHVNAQSSSDKSSALMHAVEEGRCDMVQFLMECDADVNLKDEQGETALDVSLKKGQSNCTKLLISAGVHLSEHTLYLAVCFGHQDVFPFFGEYIRNHSNSVGLLHTAVRANNIDFVRYQKCYGLDMNAADASDHTPLMMAQSLEMVHTLVQMGAEVNKLNNSQHTALMEQCKSDSPAIAKCLIDHGANLNVQDSQGNTVLLLEVLAGRKSSIQLLLDAGADLNMRNKDGQTALMEVCSRGKMNIREEAERRQMIEMLTSAGADLNCQDPQGLTALMYAVINGHAEFVSMLCASGANMDVQCDTGFTALMIALEKRENQIAENLIASGASVCTVAHDGQSPLELGIHGKMVQAVSMILEKDIDLEVEDSQGNTVLMSVLKWHLHVYAFGPVLFEAIIAKGVDLNKKNSDGDTCLMLAVKAGIPGYVKSLINGGADLEIGDSHKPPRTALTILLKKTFLSDSDIQSLIYLLQAGAKFNPSLSQCNLFHQSILRNNPVLAQLMLDAGAYSMEILLPDIYQSAKNSWSYFEYKNLIALRLEAASPLTAAFMYGSVDVARLFIDISFFTKFDLLELPRHDRIRSFLMKTGRLETMRLMQGLFSQPWSLVNLSLLQVSHAVGAHSGREQRVKKTGLPPLLQNRLLFKSHGKMAIANASVFKREAFLTFGLDDMD